MLLRVSAVVALTRALQDFRIRVICCRDIHSPVCQRAVGVALFVEADVYRLTQYTLIISSEVMCTCGFAFLHFELECARVVIVQP